VTLQSFAIISKARQWGWLTTPGLVAPFVIDIAEGLLPFVYLDEPPATYAFLEELPAEGKNTSTVYQG
jgi:hypothetical protein